MMNDTQSHDPIAVCILGMHRSGTSALARLLNVLGVDLGSDLLGAKVDNPRGFWESRQILEAHGDLLEAAGSFFDDILPLQAGWELKAEIRPHRERLLDIVGGQFAGKPLWGFKDPRTCRLLAMWKELFAEVNVSPRYVLMTRHPDEIARSLAVRSGYAYNKSLLMTLTHLLEAERDTRGEKRAIVTYEQVLGNWRGVAQTLGTKLGITWRNLDEVEHDLGDFLDPVLRHHRAMDKVGADEMIELRGADEKVARLTCQAHRLLGEAASAEREVDVAAMDAIRKDLHADHKRLTGWRQLRSIDQQFMKIEAWGIRLDAAVKALTAENDSLRLQLATQTGDAAQGGAEKYRTLETVSAAMRSEIDMLRRTVLDRDAAIVELKTHQRQTDLNEQWQSNRG